VFLGVQLQTFRRFVLQIKVIGRSKPPEVYIIRHRVNSLWQLPCDNLQSQNTEADPVWKCVTDWFRLINGGGRGWVGRKEIGKGNWKPWSVNYFSFHFTDYTDVLHQLYNFHLFLDGPSTFLLLERVLTLAEYPIKSLCQSVRLSPREFILMYETHNCETQLDK